MKAYLPAACVFLFSATPAVWARSEDAHVHGIGHMNVAIEGSRLEIEIESPGDNFVGFEHAAETPEQRASIGAAERQLRRPAALLILPKAAACTLREVDLDIPGTSAEKHGREHDHKHDDAHDGHHKDWRAHYVFVCASPAALDSIRTAPWFAAFPNNRELRVQVISGFGQSGLTLTAAKSRIALRTR